MLRHQTFQNATRNLKFAILPIEQIDEDRKYAG